MVLDEIQKELSDATTKSVRLGANIQQLTETSGKLREEVETLSEEMEKTLATERIREETIHVNKYIVPLREKLELFEAQLTTLENERDSDLSNLTLEDVILRLQEENSAVFDQLEQSNKLEKSVKEFLGERFYKEYISQLGENREVLSEGDLSRVLEDSKVLQADADKFGKFHKLTPVTWIEDKINLIDLESFSGKPNAKAKLLSVSVLTLSIFCLIFPVYLFVITGKGLLNLRVGFIYAKLSKVLKTLEANKIIFETMIKETADEEYNKLFDSISLDYSTKINKLRIEIDETELKMSTARVDALKTFIFDQESTKERILQPIKEKEREYTQILEDIHVFGGKKDSLREEIFKLNAKLKTELDVLKETHLMTNLDTMKSILDMRFLLDVVKNKPVYYELPLESQLFMYSDETEKTAIDFLKLFFCQVRRKLSPSSYVLKVWDTETLGMSFLNFYNELKLNFKIISDSPEVSEDLDTLVSAVSRRVKLIFKDFTNIQEYNEEMLGIESLPETYMFVTIFNPTTEILESKSFSRVLKLGAKLGIFVLIFQDTAKIENSLITALPEINKFWVFDNDELKRLSKELATNKIKKLLDQDPK